RRYAGDSGAGIQTEDFNFVVRDPFGQDVDFGDPAHAELRPRTVRQPFISRRAPLAVLTKSLCWFAHGWPQEGFVIDAPVPLRRPRQETRVEPNNAVRADAGVVQAGPQDLLGLRIKGPPQNGVFAIEGTAWRGCRAAPLAFCWVQGGIERHKPALLPD